MNAFAIFRNPFIIVLIFGSCGAALAILAGMADATSLTSDWNFKLYVHAPLGALASTVFIFLFANTDRTDLPRLIVLSALAGFFWKPVIEAGKVYVERVADVETANEVKERIIEMTETAEAVQSGLVSVEEGQATLGNALISINNSALKINSLEVLAELNSEFIDLETSGVLNEADWITRVVSEKIEPNVGTWLLSGTEIQFQNPERYGAVPGAIVAAKAVDVSEPLPVMRPTPRQQPTQATRPAPAAPPPQPAQPTRTINRSTGTGIFR